MKNWKKVVAVWLTASMLLGLVSMTALADSETLIPDEPDNGVTDQFMDQTEVVPEVQPADQIDDQTGEEQVGDQPADQTGDEAGEEQVEDQPADQTGDEAGEEQVGDQPVDQTGDEAGEEQVGDQPADQTGDEAGEEQAGDQPVDQTGGEAGEEQVEGQPVDQGGEQKPGDLPLGSDLLSGEQTGGIMNLIMLLDLEEPAVEGPFLVGETAYATLSEAIEAVEDEGTITVTEAAEITETVVIPAGKAITLTGETLTNGVPKGTSNNPIEMIKVQGALTLKDITLDGINSVVYGQMILVTGGGSLTMETGSAVMHQLNRSYTGVIRIEENSTFSMKEGAKISNNSVPAVTVVNSAFTLDGGTIQNNKYLNTVDHDGQAAVIVSGGRFEMKSGMVSGNQSYGFTGGGGVYLGNKATFLMSGGTISQNYCLGSYGGGVYATGNSTMEMTGGEISGNHGVYGGGVYLVCGAKLTMSGGEIKNNYADRNSIHYGGGVYVSGESYYTAGQEGPTTFIMTGGTITGNKATKNYSNHVGYGGGVAVDSTTRGYTNGTKVEIKGGAIYGNTAGDSGADLYLYQDANPDFAVLMDLEVSKGETNPCGYLTHIVEGWYYDGAGDVDDDGNAVTTRWSGHSVVTPYAVEYKGEAADDAGLTNLVRTGSAIALKAAHHAHVWKDEIIKEATCTENGQKKEVCELCGYVQTFTLAAKGHAYGAWTDNGDGTHTHVCARDASHTETADHIWIMRATTPATCEEPGEEKWFCPACGVEETRPIEALGHEYGEWTDNEDGTHTHVCARDEEHTETTEHNWGAWETVTAASYSHSGEAKRVCGDCGAEETRTIPQRERDDDDDDDDDRPAPVPKPEPQEEKEPEPAPEPAPAEEPVSDPAPDPVEEDVTEEEVPLAEAPEALEEEAVDEEEVPLAGIPQALDEVEEDVTEEEVPLAEVPKTGDDLLVWLALTAAAGCALAALGLKRKQEEDG